MQLEAFTGWVERRVKPRHVEGVSRTPHIPRHLTHRPFTLEEARRAGLTLSALRSKTWRRLGNQLYCHSGLSEDPRHLLSAWRALLPEDAVFAAATAGWLLGLDLEPINPVNIVVATRSGMRPRVGLMVRRCDIDPCDVITIRGLRVTTLYRTLLDLCLQWPAVEALVAIDMAVRAGLTSAADLIRKSAAARGRAGSRRLLALAALAAPAESPMETRLRWLLIQAGLARPEVQTDLRDSDGRFVGRADLYYPAAGLVIEYDGGNHRDRLVEDDRRQNLIVNAGFRLLRFTAADIHRRPNIVEAQVRGALGIATKTARLAPNTRHEEARGARLEPNERKGWRRLLFLDA